ncbi:transporter [Lysobacter enzymogenes]|uniref:transporter n=1 Tax=Lysobacter enzymogenes TaxID=69 RepID=UPI00099D3426|nr:transporter [Lysobacter enzymogenes]UZW60695.1 transporter [Lysobacter enzymogenes]
MPHTSLRRAALRGVASLALLSCALPAAAAGLPDPGDYAAPPPGVRILALYAQHNWADAFYARGDKAVDGLDFELDVAVARYMHYFQVGGRTADVEVILPYARQRIGLDGYRERGLGNPSVGATLWTHADQTRGEYLGWAAYLSLPLGQHRDRGFAVSEDRYALDLEVGYVRKLNDRWSLDLIGQAEFYTADRSTDVRRRPMLRGIGHLSYHVSDKTRLALSLRQTFGMRERLHGEQVAGARNDTNAMLTWAYQASDAAQVQVQYAHDLRVREGVRADALQARLVLAF